MSTNTTANPFENGNDENERLALEECVKRQDVDSQVSVLVLPSAYSDLAEQFAQLGARVTAVDEAGLKRKIKGGTRRNDLNGQITFAASELFSVPDDLPGEPFDIIVLRRGLFTVPYDQAVEFVRRLLHKLKIGGKLYVSILGLHSELGEGYPAAEEPVQRRYAPLAPTLVRKYDINGPVCLYSERNLFMLLMEAGGSVLRTLTTTHGNVKGVAVRV